MARSFLKVYFDFDEKTDELSDAEKGRLLLAMYRYALTGEKPVLSGNERFVFSTFKGEIDRDIAVYNSKVANGNMGGRPADNKPDETENNRNKPSETENNRNAQDIRHKKQEEDIKENPLTGVKEKRSRFSPPTVEEVRSYCRERGNHVDPEKFVAYYESNGWKVGKNPMKDWRAAIRSTWERDNSFSGKTKIVTAQRYEQRDYSEDDLLAVSDDLIAEARARRKA